VFVFVERRAHAHGMRIDVEQPMLFGNAWLRRGFLRTVCGNAQRDNMAVTKRLFCRIVVTERHHVKQIA
jgi:hypothetical protein